MLTNPPSLMTSASRTQFHIYLPWGKHLFSIVSRFQPGEGPRRGLLRDCTTSPINRFAALLTLLPPLTFPRPTAARPSAAACRWRWQCRTSSRTWPQQRVRRGPPLLGEAHLWSRMMSEDPDARGIGLPSLSIFIQRIGYSVAHSTEQSMSMVELLCRYSVDMVDIL